MVVVVVVAEGLVLDLRRGLISAMVGSGSGRGVVACRGGEGEGKPRLKKKKMELVMTKYCWKDPLSV